MTALSKGHDLGKVTLYGHQDSGHSYKVALALTILNTPFDYRPIDPSSSRDLRPKIWRDASRFGEIPLLLWRNEALVQSNAILLRLARENETLGWDISPNQLIEWLFWESNRIGFSLPNLLYTIKCPNILPSADQNWLRVRLENDLNYLEDVLSNAPFLMGQSVSAADVACCSYLYYTDQLGIDIMNWPSVEQWLRRIQALPRWQHPYDMMSLRCCESPNVC